MTSAPGSPRCGGWPARRRSIAGTGSWIEQKPASVVLHVRQADEERGRLATRWLVDAACKIEGGHVKTGHAVVELLTRSTSKADAVERLRRHYGRAVVAFAGDDLTDEEVFAGLGPDDFGVRVGPGTTAARYRLEGPPQVARVALGVAHRLRRGHRRPRPLLRTLTDRPTHQFCLLRLGPWLRSEQTGRGFGHQNRVGCSGRNTRATPGHGT